MQTGAGNGGRSAWRASGRNLCLAGGLGLNALLVSALENRSGFENVFVQPVAGNAGTAIGAVLEAWHGVYRQTQRVALRTLCLGPGYTAGGNQAGAGKLQAALPLSADRRRSDRDRRGAVERQQDRRLDARAHGVRPARAGQPQHSGLAARSLFHRESEHLHQASRTVPQVRRFGAGRTGGAIFRSRPQRALSRHGRPRARRSIAKDSPPPFWPATWSASTPSTAKRIRSTGSSCTPPEKPPACRCSTTPPSISSASRWSAPRATPCGASIPPASTPCSWGISSCGSRGARLRPAL